MHTPVAGVNDLQVRAKNHLPTLRTLERIGTLLDLQAELDASISRHCH